MKTNGPPCSAASCSTFAASCHGSVLPSLAGRFVAYSAAWPMVRIVLPVRHRDRILEAAGPVYFSHEAFALAMSSVRCQPSICSASETHRTAPTPP